MSKERGMIFNGDMVRAIKDGRKTQTRRPVKASTSDLLDLQEKYPHKKYNIECPFGKPGERLWVRETWQGPLVDEEHIEDYRANADKFQTPEFCEYAADGGARPEFCDLDDNVRQGWRPSIHMPRWASRITLEITAVRVERLNAISPNDAAREGLVQLPASGRYCISQGDQYFGGASRDAREVFSWLWASIYGDESWNTNPWVWVIEFKRVEVRDAK